MKLMIASDLHGSAYFARLLLRLYEREHPERLVLLGDLLYHGPRNDLPREYDTRITAELLNAASPPPLCIRGNCDGEVDQMVLSFPILADFAALFVDGRTLYLTHGHRREEAAAALHPGDVLLYGHTHVPVFSDHDGIWWVNPGSVSLPKGGSRPSCVLYEDGRLRWTDVETGETLRQETI